MSIASAVLQALRERGPLASTGLDHDGIIRGPWGRQARLARVTLDILYAMGEVGIHHRSGAQRAFDLIERLLSAEALAEPDPNATAEAYQDWHVLRRVGGLGLARSYSGEYWLAILGVLNSAVSVYYYLRITVLMYFRESEREITGLQFSWASVLALILTVIGTLYMGIFPANVLSLAQRSIAGLM